MWTIYFRIFSDPPTEDWDTFKEITDDIEDNDDEDWKKVYRVSKIVFAILLSIFVLCGAVLAKTTLLILVSNINPSSAGKFSLKTANGVLTSAAGMTYLVYWHYVQGIIQVTCTLVIVYSSYNSSTLYRYN